MLFVKTGGLDIFVEVLLTPAELSSIVAPAAGATESFVIVRAIRLLGDACPISVLLAVAARFVACDEIIFSPAALPSVFIGIFCGV